MQVLDANTRTSVRPGCVYREYDGDTFVIVQSCDRDRVTYRYEEDRTNALCVLDIRTFVLRFKVG